MIPCFTLINHIIMLFLNLHSGPKSILHFDECLPGKVLMKKEVYWIFIGTDYQKIIPERVAFFIKQWQ